MHPVRMKTGRLLHILGSLVLAYYNSDLGFQSSCLLLLRGFLMLGKEKKGAHSMCLSKKSQLKILEF